MLLALLLAVEASRALALGTALGAFDKLPVADDAAAAEAVLTEADTDWRDSLADKLAVRTALASLPCATLDTAVATAPSLTLPAEWSRAALLAVLTPVATSPDRGLALASESMLLAVCTFAVSVTGALEWDGCARDGLSASLAGTEETACEVSISCAGPAGAAGVSQTLAKSKMSEFVQHVHSLCGAPGAGSRAPVWAALKERSVCSARVLISRSSRARSTIHAAICQREMIDIVV